MNKPTIAIIGGGAAGCFAAIEVKRCCPGASVHIFEAGPRPLAKLALTGGGRCNLSNTFEGVRSLQEVYPRGATLVGRLFHEFGPGQARRWFSAEGVRLRVEDGGRVFPASGDALEIVDTLLRCLSREGVHLHLNTPIRSISEEGILIPSRDRVSENLTATGGTAPGASSTATENCPDSGRVSNRTFGDSPAPGAGSTAEGIRADRVLVTTGGGATALLQELQIPLETPCPSLFTFRTDDPGLHLLSGISVRNVRLRLPGTKLSSEGPLLLTDWGMSGPAALKLSSYAARLLSERNYRSTLLVSWFSGDQQSCREQVEDAALSNPRKMVAGTPLFGLPERLWRYLVSRSGIRDGCRWAELGSRGILRLVSRLCDDEQQISGRVRFKDEFVTCGGVSLKAVEPSRLCSKVHPWLFFAGEVLDIDAVTGGFNLQAAWTTGFVAARAAAASLK